MIGLAVHSWTFVSVLDERPHCIWHRMSGLPATVRTHSGHLSGLPVCQDLPANRVDAFSSQIALLTRLREPPNCQTQH